MNLDNFKNKKWEDLSDSERAEWKEFVEENQKPFDLWNKLTSAKKCIWCGHKFPEGIVNGEPWRLNGDMVDTLMIKKISYNK